MTLVKRRGKSSGVSVLIAVGVSKWGEVGSRVPNSKYFRDYCYICSEPIRVPIEKIGYPNPCSGCIDFYRGTPAIPEALRDYYIKDSWEGAEVISA